MFSRFVSRILSSETSVRPGHKKRAELETFRGKFLFFFSFECNGRVITADVVIKREYNGVLNDPGITVEK